MILNGFKIHFLSCVVSKLSIWPFLRLTEQKTSAAEVTPTIYKKHS